MNYYFSPIAGIARKKIAAGKFEFLGAAMADKDAKKRKCRYEVDAEPVSDSEADETSEGESEGDLEEETSEEEIDTDEELEGEESEEEEDEEEVTEGQSISGENGRILEYKCFHILTF